MKKFLCCLFIISFYFMGINVYADTYSEGKWVETSGDVCDKYSEVASAYTAYTFDSSTGKFALSGNKYSIDGPMSMVYYTVSSDFNTLYAFVPSYDSNKSLIPSSVGISANKSCADTYKVSKTSTVVSDNNSSEDEGTNNNDDSVDNNSNDTSVSGNDNNNNTDEEKVAYEDKPTEYFPGTADGSETENNDVQTTTNPSTGLGDYVIYLVIVAVVGGSVLVLKKRQMFNI